MGDSTPLNSLVLNECNAPDTFTTFVRVASGVISPPVFLTDTFPDEFIVTEVLSNSAILSVSGLGTNILSLNLNHLILNPATTGVRIRFLVRAKCGANTLSSASHSMRLQASGISSIYKKGIVFTSAIHAASLVLEPRNSVDISNGILDSTYLRRWRIRNTGVSSRIDTVWFRAIYQKEIQRVNLRVGGTLVTPTRINGDTFWYRIIRSFRNQSNFPGDTILVEDRYRIRSCESPTSSSNISVYFGCLNTAICNIATRNPTTQVPVTVPNMNAFLLSTRFGCYNNYDTVEIAYVNSGGGHATNLRMRVDLNYPIVPYQNDPDIGTSIAFIDTASVQIKLNPKGTYQRAYIDSWVRYDNNRTFWPVSNPIGTIYVDRPFLASVDTFIIRFRRFRGLYNNSYCQASEIYTNFHIWYENNCGSVAYYRPMTNVFGTAHRHYGKLNYQAPAYLQAPGQDSGIFTFSTLRGAGFSHFNDSRDFFLLRLRLPAGLVWKGDTSIMRLTQQGTPSWARRVDSVFYDTTNNVLEMYYRNLDRWNSIFTKVKLHLNCNKLIGSGNKTLIAQYFNVRMIERCGFQRLPFSCEDAFNISLLCNTNCSRGGIVPTFAQIRRNTFGRPDNNNDGRPDPSGSLDMTKVEWDKLAPRDTFTLTYKGRIFRGPSSPTNFSFGFGHVYVPLYANLLTQIDGTITVFDSSANTIFTVNNLPITRRDTGGRSRFIFNFSGNVSGFPSGFIWNQGDTFLFRGRFVWNRNVVEGSLQDNTISTVNNFFVSHLSNPTNDTARYRCADLPTNYRVVQVYKGYNGGFQNRATGCTPLAVYSDFFQSVGDCCGNYAGSVHFPNEYRLFTTCDTLRIRIPSGYILDSTRIDYYYTQGAGRAALYRFYNNPPISINGEWYTFHIGNRFTTNGGTFVPSTTGSYFVMYNFIKASCAIPLGNIQTEFTADRWIGRNTWTGITTRGVANNHNRGVYEYTGAAQLDLMNVGVVSQPGVNPTVSWQVRVQNNSTSAVSNNTWLAFRSNSGNIIVDSVELSSNPANIPQTNGIYRLGNIAANGAGNTYRIYARYSACAQDSLTVFTGWSCSTYPLNLAGATGSCRSDSVRVFVVPQNPLVQSDLISSPAPSVNLCDTLQWTVSVSNRQLGAAGAINLDVVLPNFGIGSTLIPRVEYRYPWNSGTWTRITPANLGLGVSRLYLSDSIAAIRNNGLRPISESPNNEIHIRIKIVTNCNYLSGSIFRFVTNARKICGESLPPETEFYTIRINGAPSEKIYLTQHNIPQLSKCDSNFLVRVAVRNLELAPTNAANDLVWITLPSGVYFVNGSTSFLRNALTPNAPRLDTIGGLQRLSWPLNTIPLLDSSVFTFSVRSPANIPCGTSTNFILQTITRFTATCNSNLCTSFLENNRQDINRPILKPNLRYLAGTGFIRITQDTTIGNVWASDSLILRNLVFSNSGNGSAILPVLRVFYDSNNNNLLDIGERILMRDTFALTILSGQSYTYSRTVLAPKMSLPASNRIKIETIQNCNCNNNRSIYTPAATYIALLAFYDNFVVNKINNTAHLSWQIPSEAKVVGYEIQRKLSGQNQFTTLLKSQNLALDPGQNYFHYIDSLKDIFSNRIDYRLIYHFKNKNSEYSKIRYLLFQSKPNTELFSVSPNPATNAVYIQSSLFDYNIQIISAEGKLILEKKNQSLDCNLPISFITPGIYTLVFTHSNGEIIETQKLIVLNSN